MSATLVLTLTMLTPSPQVVSLPESEVPAQRITQQALAGGASATGAAPLIDLIQTNVAPNTWQANGGKWAITPFGLGAGGAGAAGGNANAGPGGGSLIDLIQTNVAPTTWDINGGRGTILPFRR